MAPNQIFTQMLLKSKDFLRLVTAGANFVYLVFAHFKGGGAATGGSMFLFGNFFPI